MSYYSMRATSAFKHSCHLLFLPIIALFAGAFQVKAQPKLEFNMKKPEQFKERKLGSEKMADKKFTPVRRFFQNTYTHYNYYFNANQQLNTIIQETSERKTDDYSELLPFYRYTLKETSGNAFLDSIIQTSTAGILLHDLRNDWIDNMYLLLGKAYLLKNHPDSAAMTFQYINYSFAPKEKDGYDLPIGSNAGDEGYNAFSISTKEKTGNTAYLTKQPPSRNDALAWQVRAFTEMNNYLDASSLVSTLQSDPLFPERLQPLLEEHTAYMFYKLDVWDSAAVHLDKANEKESDRILKARRYYLAGQLYALAGMNTEASEAFAKATGITLDPVMDVYARLNTIRLDKSKDPAKIDKNVAELRAMAKKERYREYSDIILYAAALIELERNNYTDAELLLQDAFASKANTTGQKSRTAYLLGETRVAMKKFGYASPAYDSVNESSLKEAQRKNLAIKKPATKQIYEADKTINLYDSLLTIAAMEEPGRSDLVKKISRELRKQRGVKEENTGSASAALTAGTVSPDLFGGGVSGWYFTDPTRRSSGFELFRQRWGDRPNADNWRRSSAIKQNATGTGPGVTSVVDAPPTTGTPDNFDTTDISFDNLYSRLPLTPEKVAAANVRKANALYQKARAIHEGLEDYPEAAKVYEQLLALTDTGMLVQKSLFDLIHCYTQMGETAKADAARKRLLQQFADSPEAVQLKAGSQPGLEKNDEATAAYAAIYELFLSGKFDAAIQAKQEADKKYGANQWSPQLQYIESIYYIKERKDSLALAGLDKLVKAYPSSPMAARAKLLLQYLPKRDSIETYLTNLKVERQEDAPILERNIVAVERQKPAEQPKTPAVVTPQPTVVATDSAKTNIVAAIPKAASPYDFKLAEPQIVGIYLKNIDPTYVNEVLYSFNATSQRNFNGNTITASKQKVTDDLWLVLLQGEALVNAEAAIQYIDYLRPVSAKSIIPWLDVARYRFFITTAENLEKLKAEPNFDLYLDLLHQMYPFKL